MTPESIRPERQYPLSVTEQGDSELLAAIVNSFDDAIIGTTLDGVISCWNPGAERLYGYLAGEVLGREISFLIPPDRFDEIRATLDLVAHDEYVAHRDTKRLRKDGTVLDISVTGSPIHDATGAVIGAFTTHRDISERLSLERARRALENRMRQYERLESLGELAGGIAHDFNNLLAVISNFASFVADELDDEQAVRSDLEKIQEAARRANALTRQLRSFARRDVFEIHVVNLNEVIVRMEDLLRGTLGGRINFTTSLAPDLSAIEADVRQLEEILVHLVTNARDAMPEGGILSIDTENVELDASYAGIRPGLDPGNYVLMKVSDNGSGMDQFVLSRVFEPFFTTKARGDGTGLGLPMVFGIVAQSGGDIEIESQVDVGTTCRVLLPATDQSATLVVPDPPPRALIGSETVLVVEDEESMREATERILTRNGYKVLACASGPEAIVAAQNHRGKIDLLITDVIMPEMLGTDVAANIEQVVPSVPVLFMSGYARPVLGPRVTEDTVLLAKPFSAQALLAKVRGVIDRSRPNREGR